MSGESVSTDDNRSRSLLRQVREKFGGNRQRVERRAGSSSAALINTQRISAEHVETSNNQTKLHVDSTAPVSFSHHLSLLVNVKSRFRKTRKTSTALSSPGNDDRKALSLPPINSDSESSTTTLCEVNQDITKNELDLTSSPELPITTATTTPRIDDQVTVVQRNSADMSTADDDNISQLNSETHRASNTNRKNLNKLKDHITQRAKIVMNKSPSLTSLLTNVSVKTSSNDTIYWIELHIERGKDLSIKDFSGTSDPYIKVYYGNDAKFETNIIFKNLNPVWNEKTTFFVHDLNIPIYFHIFDYDRIGRDESMGSARIDLWKVPLEKVYNATLDLENEKRTDGKTGMLKMNITITPKPPEFRDEIMRTVSKQSNRKSSLTGRLGNTIASPLLRRTVDVFIIEGRNFSVVGASNKMFSPSVRLKFGTNKKYRTQTIKSTLNPKWHQSFIYEILASELPPLEITVIDDTSSSGDLIGRGCCNLTHLDEERTHKISLDLDDNAGVIDLFVTITGIAPLQDATNDSDTSSNVSLDVMPSKLTDEDMQYYSFFSSLRSITPIFDVGKVEIKIYQARDLSAKDINGKSDPFCVVELDSTRLRTHTIYKTLDPVWNKSFIIPVQDIHSTLELAIYDEDTNKTTEFIGKVVIPLLAINNGEKRWMGLKDRKCILPVKGIIEIEANVVYTNLRAILRTFNPRQVRYYQQDGKFRVGVFKQHINRVRNMLKYVLNAVKFINYCFEWENPLLSFCAFISSLIIIWNFQLYMLPFALLLIFAWNAVVAYRRGSLGKPFSTLGDETVSAVIQPVTIDEDVLDGDGNTKEQKRSLLGVIHGIQDTVFEIQGYVDELASTMERIKNVFNFTVPWLSILAITVLTIISTILYHIPLRYLVLAFIINKFTKRFRKPKGYIDNNELADFISRLPSDPELLQYRELKILTRIPTPKKYKRTTINGK
ncbi:unnamed protein product [Rotaria magnacalcarata]|uniref:C2 domain-containing protein n=3 Tax=Rotaria magnacalcarata TaxID=392030 RepID=A0A815ZT57_9BILA|nr:unnamed protein product [Rotaria magnacalcarata]CAF1587283.1 unnamed protein product [Rotaria magnacalcarata]CAF2074530.1 unnamed protein product [Rotaria magnacalcarata]CAF2156432.1 unnamed protein product [Rotaria magnacalcarata]CAF3852175.1 unnamed protein product [Rotaria magnacalcarata]